MSWTNSFPRQSKGLKQAQQLTTRLNSLQPEQMATQADRMVYSAKVFSWMGYKKSEVQHVFTKQLSNKKAQLHNHVTSLWAYIASVAPMEGMTTMSLRPRLGRSWSSKHIHLLSAGPSSSPCFILAVHIRGKGQSDGQFWCALTETHADMMIIQLNGLLTGQQFEIGMLTDTVWV